MSNDEYPEGKKEEEEAELAIHYHVDSRAMR